MKVKTSYTVLFTLMTTMMSVFVFAPITFGQGSLTPPGAPAPTMKTLDQLEPRTPVDAAHTPGNFLAQYIISQPGSYYLTTNIVGVNGKRAIQINTNCVTLDLKGFCLSSGSGNGSDAIYFPSIATNIIIRDGIITSWPIGAGINYSLCQGGVFENLTLSANGSGISCGDGSEIRNCTINGNAQNGIFVNGSGCFIHDNNCMGNNAVNNSGAAAIYVFGTQNRIENNHVTSSGTAGYGIYLSVSNNLVIRNSVINGGVNNYRLPAGSYAGPLITTYGTITNNNPWANFSF